MCQTFFSLTPVKKNVPSIALLKRSQPAHIPSTAFPLEVYSLQGRSVKNSGKTLSSTMSTTNIKMDHCRFVYQQKKCHLTLQKRHCSSMTKIKFSALFRVTETGNSFI